MKFLSLSNPSSCWVNVRRYKILANCFNYSPFFMKIYTLFKKALFFPAQSECCLIFSWIEIQMLLTWCLIHIDIISLFYISNIFISNTRLKLAKNQADAKQHPEAQLWLFENYSHSSSILSSKNKRTYILKTSERTCVSLPILHRQILYEG